MILGIILPPILLSFTLTTTSADPFGQIPEGHLGAIVITLFATLITGAIVAESVLPHWSVSTILYLNGIAS